MTLASASMMSLACVNPYMLATIALDATIVLLKTSQIYST